MPCHGVAGRLGDQPLRVVDTVHKHSIRIFASPSIGADGHATVITAMEVPAARAGQAYSGCASRARAARYSRLSCATKSAVLWTRLTPPMPWPQPQMNFGGDAKKAWKDIWGCGQGIGGVSRVQSTADFVAQLRREYLAARARLAQPEYA